MKPGLFDYTAAATTAEALAVLAERGFDAKLLAGGQSLIPLMNFRLCQPAILLDLNRLQELDYVRVGAHGDLEMGAMVRQRTLEKSPEVARLAPLMHEALPWVAHPQIRNRGTLGGSLAHADPAGELPAVALALDATLVIESVRGRREIAARDFYVGLLTTDLAADEMVIEIRIPPPGPRTGYAFLELARRHGDYAQAGVAAIVELTPDATIERARLVFLSVGDTPLEASRAAELLHGERPSSALIEEAAVTAAQQEIEPTSDIHASAAYKRRIARVLARRALETALERARDGAPTG